MSRSVIKPLISICTSSVTVLEQPLHTASWLTAFTVISHLPISGLLFIAFSTKSQNSFAVTSANYITSFVVSELKKEGRLMRETSPLGSELINLMFSWAKWMMDLKRKSLEQPNDNQFNKRTELR